LGNETWHIGAASGAVIHRVYNLPCSEADGLGTNCAGMGCYYGPCGAHNVSVTGGTPSYVFKPVSNPTVCGWQAGGTSGAYDPEPYPDQELGPAAPSTCPWTACPGGGIRAVMLQATAVASGATGKVESVPEGIDLEGAGSVTAPFVELNVELIARARGHDAR